MSRNSSRPQQPTQGASKSSLDISHVEAEISSLYDIYIVTKSAPITELEKSLHTLFTNERFVSMRAFVPKGLNAMGTELLESSGKLWLLCIAIQLIKTPSMKSLFPLLKSAVATMGNKREFIEGLDAILSIKDIEMTPEDTQNLDKLLNLEAVPNVPETIAVSECGKFALVKLTAALQKKFAWTCAITPVEGNEWVTKDPSISHHNSPRQNAVQILVKSNYGYYGFSWLHINPPSGRAGTPVAKSKSYLVDFSAMWAESDASMLLMNRSKAPVDTGEEGGEVSMGGERENHLKSVLRGVGKQRGLANGGEMHEAVRI